MLAAFKGDRWEILRSLPLVVALFVQESVPEAVARWAHWSDNPKAVIGVKIGCAVILILGVACADALLHMRAMNAVRRNSGLRKFEGFWLQNVGIKKRPYSIARIEFDRHQGLWNYYGVGFDEDFNPASDWRTYSLAFRKEESDRPWFFAGQAHLRTYDRLLKRFAQTGGAGNILPRLCLPMDPREEIEGTVADIEEDGSRTVFKVTLRRLPPDLAGKITSVEAMLHMENKDVRKFFEPSDTPANRII
jgi:hypothetical protein